jgi:hypothetical protein
MLTIRRCEHTNHKLGGRFEPERGDMLRVVEIWDDEWARGLRTNERTEDHDGKHNVQRDVGVSKWVCRPATIAGTFRIFLSCLRMLTRGMGKNCRGRFPNRLQCPQ